jgi:hypothetical protein
VIGSSASDETQVRQSALPTGFAHPGFLERGPIDGRVGVRSKHRPHNVPSS